MGITYLFNGYNLDLKLNKKKMKLHLVLLLALAILPPMMMNVDAQADDGVEVSDGDDKKAEELIKEADKSDDEKSEDSDKESDNEDSDSDAETPNDKGERNIELEDMQLWKNMDLNKDGRLTIAEYERFARSPNAQRFVRNMKEHKAVEQWAAKIGIDVAKAKAAMMLGANAQRRRSYLARQRNARILAARRRAAIIRRNKMIAYKRHQARKNYWARLGYPYLQQQYYNAMKASAGRRGGEL